MQYNPGDPGGYSEIVMTELVEKWLDLGYIFFIFVFKHVYLFILGESERQTERETDRQRESQAVSMLSAEPMWGLIP